MIHDVIVLAAGAHHRMGGARPKALLSLRPDDPGGVSFLSRNLTLYRGIGVRRTWVVVTAASAPAFADLIADDVRLVVLPPCSDTTGSTVSMVAGMRRLVRDDPALSRTLVTDADVICERALLEAVADLAGTALVTIDRVSGDSEEVRVYGRGERTPALIGKGLNGPMVDGLTLLGESLGLIVLEPADLLRAAGIAHWITGEPPRTPSFGYGGRGSEHEEVWQYMFALGRLPVARLDGSLLFSECDFPEDLTHIRDELYPAVLRRDR